MPDKAQSSAAPFVVERKRLPTDQTHKCRLPGFIRRRVLGLRYGAIVRCAGYLYALEAAVESSGAPPAPGTSWARATSIRDQFSLTLRERVVTAAAVLAAIAVVSLLLLWMVAA